MKESNFDEDPKFGKLPLLVSIRDASEKMSDIKIGNKKMQIIRSYRNQYVIAFVEI